MVHPQRWHGAISAATGFVVAAMGAVALLGAFDAQTVPAILRALERGGELTLVFRISIAGIAVLTGLGWAAVGMRRMFRLWVPPGIPKDFADIETVRTAVTKRVLDIYAVQNPDQYGLLGRILGERLFTMVPRLRAEATELLATARRGVVLLILAVVAAAVLREMALSPAMAALRWGLGAAPLGILALGMLGAAGARLGGAALLFPRSIPPVTSHRQIERIDGTGHPDALLHIIEEEARFLEWEGFPIRLFRQAPALAASGVADTGTFAGFLVVEQQPQPLPPAGQAASALLASVGGALTVAAFYGWLWQAIVRIPVGLVGPPSPRDVAFIAVSAGSVAVPFFLFVMGRRLLAAGGRVAGGFRYRSKLFLADLAGTFSRSQVRVGKARTDSIESENIVVRSEVGVTYFGAEVLSEALTLDGPRDLLALEVTPDIKDDTARLAKAIHIWRDKGVRPVGVDLTSSAAQDIIQANIAVERAKTAPTPAALGGGPAEPTLPRSAVRAELPPKPAEIAGDTKVCPECAETVKAAAKKCRFCGYRFDANQ
jgi:hypothetical protein